MSCVLATDRCFLDEEACVLFEDAAVRLEDASIRLPDARVLLADACVLTADARILLADASILPGLPADSRVRVREPCIRDERTRQHRETMSCVPSLKCSAAYEVPAKQLPVAPVYDDLMGAQDRGAHPRGGAARHPGRLSDGGRLAPIRDLIRMRGMPRARRSRWKKFTVPRRARRVRERLRRLHPVPRRGLQVRALVRHDSVEDLVRRVDVVPNEGVHVEVHALIGALGSRSEVAITSRDAARATTHFIGRAAVAKSGLAYRRVGGPSY